MTANTATAGQTSESKGLGGLGKAFYIILVLFVAFILYKGFYRPDDPDSSLWWTLVVGWLLLGCLGFILFAVSPDWRRFALFVFFFLALVVLVSAFFQGQLTNNSIISQAVWDSGFLAFLLGGYADTVIWSLILGLLVAFLLISLPLLAIAYAASVYVLALHEIEGVSRWDAMRYVITLILGNNLPFIEVENGQALITKEASKMGVIGGPGELIIKHGNVVVLERGGKITRVVNAGVTKLKPLEAIRNIFVLPPHTRFAEIEHVLTKDRIPLKITLGIKIQIEPASEADKRPESRIAPHGEGLTKKLDDGLYQVYEGTVRKAALMSQATSYAKRELTKCDANEICLDVEETTWYKVAGSLPEAELRDHVMSHRFDELFELVNSAPGEKPKVRVNKRTIYEIEQAILEEIKVTRVNVLGVLVRGVDIGRIKFPRKLTSVVVESMTAKERAEGHAEAIETIGIAKTEALALLLDRMIGVIATELPLADENTIRRFIALLRGMYQRALTDDVLVKEIMEEYTDALKKMAESEGPKVIGAGTPMDATQWVSPLKTNGKN
jgi:hypothetical protein